MTGGPGLARPPRQESHLARLAPHGDCDQELRARGRKSSWRPRVLSPAPRRPG